MNIKTFENYSNYISANPPMSANKLRYIYAEKKILTKKLKKLEDIENILKKILTCEKEIISWQYNYTEDAKGEILSDVLKKELKMQILI